MSIQLPLPAGWARKLASFRDPAEHLAELKRDVLNTKVEIRSVLERLAEKHGVSMRDVNRSMQGYADDMLSDLIYEVERGLVHEIEETDRD